MITGLSIHLRPMVRKGKSLLFGHISRILKIISLSQTIQKCLIRREMEFFFWRSFLNKREICPKSKLLPFLIIGLR